MKELKKRQISKTVILAINAKYIHSSLSAWILAESVSRFSDSHTVEVVEANINQSDGEITSQVIAHNPDVVGISTYIWNASKLPRIIALIREHIPGTIIVLGGYEASHNAEYWLENHADYIIQGEGEQSFPDLLNRLSQGETPPKIIKANICEEIIDPYSKEYVNSLKGRIAYIETSRGCPFECTFCLSGGGNSVRFFSIEQVKEQLHKLSQSRARVIKFVDRTFNCNAKRAYNLFKFVIGLDTEKTFHFEAAADLFDACTLSLLSTAPKGRIQLEIGIQSFFAPALVAVNRKTDLPKAVENIRRLLAGKNIHIHIDLIAGLPYETLTDFQNSFNRAYELGAHHLQLGFLKMLHGSKIRERENSIVFTEEPPYEIIRSPWLSEVDLDVIKRVEYALKATYNKGRFLSAIDYALTASEITPFELYRKLGGNACTPERVSTVLDKLSGVDSDILLEHMICDFMASQKGMNMPFFMRIYDKPAYMRFRSVAEEKLGRKIHRHEVAVLPSGKGVFLDSENCDIVSGLYRTVVLD
ncbi:MAG: B12-binding domain-containing radical SAM protein [Oscillospiraceae bacterium]|nr:B12-binding domain-containing radical SAM protein [Oscillospiraceae bacterium]